MNKVLNDYIVYDLDGWPRNTNNNFKFKNCLFVATNIVKSTDKEKYLYSGYRITFYSVVSWSFDNDTVRNVITFGVDNSSWSHSENCKNDFLILGAGPTYGINGSFESPEKKFNIDFTKANTKFFWIYTIMLIIVICLLIKKNSLNLKLTIKMLTFQLSFVSEVYLMALVILSLGK